MRKHSRSGLGLLRGAGEDDPLAGVANLFDTGIVFALGYLVALVSALNLLAIFDPKSKVTVTTERSDGSLEVVTKEGQKTKVRRMTKHSQFPGQSRMHALNKESSLLCVLATRPAKRFAIFLLTMPGSLASTQSSPCMSSFPTRKLKTYIRQPVT